MFKNVFLFKKLDVKAVCTIAMLIACTVVLSYFSGLLRIGNISKFSISFISVYIAASAFGPIIGGFVGAVADLISFFVNPTGGFLWQLTLIEFAYGFIFGIMFYRQKGELKYLWTRIFACVAIQLATNLVVKTMVLMSVGYVPSNFMAAVALRAPACIVMAVMQLILLAAIEKYLPMIIKTIRKEAR